MRAILVVVMGASLVACGSDRDAGRKTADEAPVPQGVASTEDDVAALGREIFDLIDRAMSYRSAHRGQLPRNLRELGIDDLTPTTSRTLTVADRVPTVSVTFRAPERHTVASCRGTNAILEESSLAGGTFSLTCNLVSGGITTLKASR